MTGLKSIRHALPRSVALAAVLLLSAAAYPDQPAPDALHVAPEQSTLTGGRSSQQLLITRQTDGREVDVTAQCRFESSNSAIATVSDDGIVQPVADGVAAIQVSLEGLVVQTAVTVENTADRSVNFRNDALPVLSRLSCNQMGCHGSPKGKSGFRLSLFAADMNGDYEEIVRHRTGRLVNFFEPEQSLLLEKATMTVAHGGGQRLLKSDPEYQTLVDWIRQQAPIGGDAAPTLERIEVFPKQRTLRCGDKQPLLVQAHYSDGSTHDVTALAQVSSGDELIATVSDDATVTMAADGEAIIMARFAGQMAISRLVVPQVHDAPFPKVPRNNHIDELVLRKLRQLNIAPSELTTDSEFIRRVFLDTLGTLPTSDEVRDFLADQSDGKRARLIDDLLERPEFVDHRTLRWCDLLRVNRDFPIYLREKGMWTYYNWIHLSMAENKPMDQFVHELLTSQGNTYETGPANFFRTTAYQPQETAEQASTLFLGLRLDCAHCHNHPFEEITWDDNLGMAAFFSGVRRKRLETDRQDEDVVYLIDGGAVRHPETNQVVAARFLDGRLSTTGAGEDPRAVLADWMTSPENPWFARNMANRVWYWLMGRGIVHEPDDFRRTNPPSNPELLDYLADEFVHTGYDMQHIYRLILNSRTYQLSSKTNASNVHDAVHFSHYPYRQLDAEQALDALSQATGVPEQFSGLPVGTRAAELPDTYVRSEFLDLFGRPMRATTCECERSGEMHVGQSMHLLSSDHIETKLSSKGNLLEGLLAADMSDEQIVDELYLAALSRFPTADEKQRVLAAAISDDRRKEWFEDLTWALLSTKEFLFNH